MVELCELNWKDTKLAALHAIFEHYDNLLKKKKEEEKREKEEKREEGERKKRKRNHSEINKQTQISKKVL